MSYQEIDNKYQTIPYQQVFDGKRKLLLRYFNESELPYKCFKEFFKTFLDKDGKPINTFNPRNMLILSNRSKKPFQFVFSGYIHTMFKLPFTHSTVFVIGYKNDKENENNFYNFLKNVIDTVKDLLPKDKKSKDDDSKDEIFTKNVILHTKVKNPILGYRYIYVHPSELIDIDKCKAIVRDDTDSKMYVSLVLIQHKGFYVPFFYLNNMN